MKDTINDAKKNLTINENDIKLDNISKNKPDKKKISTDKKLN